MRQRYYDTNSGRFTRRDTHEGRLSEPLTLHKYLYANNNPLNYTDPSGLFASAAESNAAFTVFAILATIKFVGITTGSYNPERLGGFGDDDPIVVPSHTGHSALERLFWELGIGGYNDDNSVPVYGQIGGYGQGVGSLSLSHLSASREEIEALDGSTRSWHRGSYASPAESLVDHFKRHGEEVGADDALDYLNKAEEFKRNLRRAEKKKIDGPTPGVIRFRKNGKYIDLAPEGGIISFGR